MMDIHRLFKGPKTAPAEQYETPKTDLLLKLIHDAIMNDILVRKLFLHPQDYAEILGEPSPYSSYAPKSIISTPELMGLPVILDAGFPLMEKNGRKTKHGNVRQRLYIPQDSDKYDTKNTPGTIQTPSGRRISTVLQGSSFNPSSPRSNC